MTRLADDPLDRDSSAAALTAGRTDRQQAIAALIGETIAAYGVDYGGGDITAVHAETIGYRIMDAFRDAGLSITRRR